jgi:hypothetical protein
MQALTRLVERLDELSIPYAVGGSLASATHGEPRSTRDVDVLVALEPAKIEALVAALRGDFYVDRDSVREACQLGTSFNVIHLRLYLKIDVFVAGERLLDREQLARRVAARPEADVRPVMVTSPEVIVLRKLDWRRHGGGASVQQWRDVLGVLKVQASRLDLEYLRQTARELGLADELEQALAEAGRSE